MATPIPPPPRKFGASPRPEMTFLHWLPQQGRWESIDRQLWREFLRRGGTIPSVTPGIHHFVVCVNEKGVPINLLPRKYLIGQAGTIAVVVDGLSYMEREDYDRLSTRSMKWTYADETRRNEIERWTSTDQARLDEIEKKMNSAKSPPKESIAALIRSFSLPPKSGSEAERLSRDWSL